MFELLSESKHKAMRKEHICCECETRIFIGQEYVSTRSLWDGDFQSVKAHVECLEAAQSRDMFGLLEVDYNAREFVLCGMSNDSECADDVLDLAKTKYPALYERLLTHEWVEKAVARSAQEEG